VPERERERERVVEVCDTCAYITYTHTYSEQGGREGGRERDML
jgi:hypothetical protein